MIVDVKDLNNIEIVYDSLKEFFNFSYESVNFFNTYFYINLFLLAEDKDNIEINIKLKCFYNGIMLPVFFGKNSVFIEGTNNISEFYKYCKIKKRTIKLLNKIFKE